MRIEGMRTGARYTRVCVLPRPDGGCLSLTMQPLPLGFAQRLRERGIIPPTPPVRVARDSAGRPLRDGEGQAVTMVEEFDGEYVCRRERYHQRLAVLAVAESLKADAQVTFAAMEPAGRSGWDEYADALHAEMAEAGFSEGDLAHLCGEACRLSNLSGEHLREARDSFSCTGPRETG